MSRCFPTADYATNPAATTFGKGIEIRLVGGELGVPVCRPFPRLFDSGSLGGRGSHARTWRHVASSMRAPPIRTRCACKPSWVRIFVDGREIPTRILNEGLALAGAKTINPHPTRFRVGWDNATRLDATPAPLDEVAVWTRALNDPEITSIFESKRFRTRPSSTAQAGVAGRNSLAQRSLAQATPMQLGAKSDGAGCLRAECFGLHASAPTVMVMQEMDDAARDASSCCAVPITRPATKSNPAFRRSLLGAWPAGAPKNRLGLARWLTKPDHPLTSRVVVNRFWQQLFGHGHCENQRQLRAAGRVAQPSRTARLAGSRVHRLRLERQGAAEADGALGHLPAGFSAPRRNLSRAIPRTACSRAGRVSACPAEIIRDQALLVSGLLKNRLGGPSVYPYQPKDLYKGIVVAANYPGTKYVASTGDDLVSPQPVHVLETHRAASRR